MTKPETKAAKQKRLVAERIQARKEMIERIDAEVNATPIAKAVEPVKAEAIERAEQGAKERIANLTKQLEEAGGDINVLAPYPNSLRTNRDEYTRAIRKRNLFISITDTDQTKPVNYTRNGPEWRVIDPAKVLQFIEEAKLDAAEQYRAFVHKLVKKIGPTTEATLSGSHVWGYSTLFITKADGTKEKWRTHQIVNVSVYGKLFNQWPSRKVK